MHTVDQLIVIVLFDQVDLLDVTGPPEVFHLARRETEEAAAYDVVLAAETMDPVVTAAGVRVLPDVTFDALASRSIDTVIVPGAVEADDGGRLRPTVDPVVVRRVRELSARARRMTSVCVGAHILAAAGLLDGKRATTHWSTAQQLAADHPAVEVDADPIFIRQGDVWTGAGISACLDLSLALIADDLGEAVALRVARQLVMYLKRPSGQSQFSVPLEQASTTRRIEDLRHYILRHIAEPLTVTQLAEHAHISDRQLTRIFKNELGTTPHAYIESVRVERARHQLESTDATLERVAAACGFGTLDTLVRSFRRRLDTTPTEYRRRFRTTPA
ncbi:MULTISPECIES: GlxA family transcriptional regulator [Streptomyces]|uniref:Transcriptional regulator GlxA family with amidase domain n=1 Tax=Streptomyces murinus TaxID=33900 RepID=A0A7W3RKV5_STRMR|nr:MULTISPECIES: helix-turn-helix domain-containing protein [Streptomyces]NDK24476.1 helix-turn-helix domain-containing protein [Streptomyces sp. TR1341]MBA9053442.1 transcriptional regulator GlxA family with amidase domain [Streptomyces murinus]UWW94572.1 helix-turn-helix domain-containing protein [Streptomyces murinus]WSI85309.1 helix-turn-helix domain-containing protein [Streptomyces murinus]WUD07007.1 helix-turn-helix domain-containing protein [Streptomyces murinus]